MKWLLPFIGAAAVALTVPGEGAAKPVLEAEAAGEIEQRPQVRSSPAPAGQSYSVPEPAGWMTMLVALGIFGGALKLSRRRK